MSTYFSHFFEKINQISPLETSFTEVLDTIAVKPKTLYFYGKMPKNVLKNDVKPDPGGVMAAKKSGERPKTVAIVGSRHNTKYGEEVAYKLAYELAKQGVVVVSGLAYGIDSIAHQGCLDGGGVTVAVLGTPIDRIYPRAHIGLAEKILAQGGAVMSEYGSGNAKNTEMPPGKNGARAAFLHRNRLIAGLSDVVVVVEAAVRSGSLNTATHALAQGKEVLAVPGNITNVYSQGCNRLIQEGAFPYSEPDDVLRLLFPENYIKKCKKLKQAGIAGDSDAETAVLKALLAGARKGEEIMKLALLPPEVFSQAITLLEIKAQVRALGANSWMLA